MGLQLNGLVEVVKSYLDRIPILGLLPLSFEKVRI